MKRNLSTLLIVTAIYAVLCFTKHQDVRFTADSMLYVSIAEKYLSGDFQNAINGYWGPLLAWILIPFLYLEASPVFAITVLDAIAGVLIIIGIWLLSFRFEITERIRGVILIAALPVVLKFSLVQPMDLLLVCILIYYLTIVFDNNYTKKSAYGMFCGVLGALAYFTKAYAFPFFIAHFLIINIIHYLRNIAVEDRRKVVRNAVAGFVMFFLISGAWIMIISDKYGHFTFSTMRDTNFNAPGPEAMGGGLEFGVPVFYEGFFAPPNDTAFVVWEDPSYIRGKPWSAWQSWDHFRHFVRLFLKNVSDALKIFESFSTLSFAIIIAYLLLLFEKRGDGLLYQNALIDPLMAIIVFSGGYLLFHLEERYLWLVNILLLIMGGNVLTILFQKKYFENDFSKGILVVFFIVSFIFTPVKYFLQAGRGGMDSDMYHMSSALRQYNINGNIASNREYVPVHDAWHKTFRLAYWLNGRYYGQAGDNITDEDLEKELKKYDINYYFIWGGSNIPEFLKRYREVTENKIPDLKIYDLRMTVSQ